MERVESISDLTRLRKLVQALVKVESLQIFGDYLERVTTKGMN
jgi:hypothetical protein